MIGAFWNIRGLGQPGKIQCLGDFRNTNHVDFVGFFETKRENIDNNIFKGIAGRHDFCSHILLAVKTAGGILVGLKMMCWRLLVFSIRNYVL